MSDNISNFGDLNIVIKGTSTAAANAIKKTITALDELDQRARSLSTVGADRMSRLATALNRYSAVPKPNLTKANANAINSIVEAVNAVPADVANKLEILASGLIRFNEVAPQKLASSAAQFARLPKALKEIQSVDFTKLTPQITRLVQVMTPLAQVMSQVAAGFTAMPPRINQYMQSVNQAVASTNNMTKSSKGLMGWLQSARSSYMAVAFAATRVAKFIGGMVHSSNIYIENLNLFTVTMGRATKATMDFAESLRDAVGIDPAEWIKQQGIFKHIVSGFGVVEEQANLISKNLTQLVYDSASYFNTTVEESMQKFEAAMAQQSRPLRRFGYDISMTALREEALALGIEKSVDMMSRAEKAQLTYIVLMNQSKNVMGDMARTILTPANALRVLGMQAEQAKRALGNSLMPAVMDLVPVFTALLQVVVYLGDALARFLGYEPPAIDYSKMDSGPLMDIAGAFDDIEDNANAAGAAIKAFRNFVLGFDELHIIPTPGSGGSGGGGGGFDSGWDLGLALPEYDFLEQLAANDGKVQRLKDTIIGILEVIGNILKPFLALIESVGIYLVAAFAGKKVVNAFSKFLTFIGRSQTSVKNFADKAKGVGAVVGGAFISGFTGYLTGKSYTADNLTMGQSIMGGLAGTLVGGGVIAKGLMALSVGGPLAIGIGLAAGAVATLVGWLIGVKTETAKLNKEAKLAEYMGQIQMTSDELRALVNLITTNDYTIAVNAYFDAANKRDEIAKELDTIIEEISMTRRLVSLGVDLDIEDYTKVIEEYLETSQRYLEQHRITMLLAFDVTFGAGDNKSVAGKKLEQDFMSYYSNLENELGDIRKQITDVLQQLYDDAITEVDAYAQINALVDMYDEAVAALYEHAEKAKFRELEFTLSKLTSGAKFDLSGFDLDNFREAVLLIENDRRDVELRANQAMGETLLGISALYQEGTKEFYDMERAANADHYNNLMAGMSRFRNQYYSTELKYDMDAGSEMFSEFFQDEITVMARAQNLIYNQADLDAMYNETYGKIDRAQRDAAKDIVKEMAGIIEVDKKILTDAYAAGAAPPVEFLAGFREHMQLSALAGDIEGFYYLMGEEMTKSPSAIALLRSTYGIGADMMDSQALGVLSNVSVVRNSMGQVFAEINGDLYDMTPELYSNLTAMGMVIPSGVDRGISLGLSQMDITEKLKGRLLDLASETESWGTFENAMANRGVEAITGAFDYISYYKDYPDFKEAVLSQFMPGSVEYGAIGRFFSVYDEQIRAFVEDAKMESAKFENLFKLKTQKLIVESSLSTIAGRVSGHIDIRPQAYATGGFPGAKELFWANEEGNIEMIGKQGTRSMVANNMQIIEGISHGVIEGMVMAAAITQRNEDGSGGDIIIQIGDEVFYNKTKAEARRESQRTGSPIRVMG